MLVLTSGIFSFCAGHTELEVFALEPGSKGDIWLHATGITVSKVTVNGERWQELTVPDWRHLRELRQCSQA